MMAARGLQPEARACVPSAPLWAVILELGLVVLVAP